jgi:colanic acid biosynthesis glycosyl transferase WcaI
MRIAFICPVFPPEPAPAGVMAMQLARALALDGHEVNVFTQFPNRPQGKVFPGYRRQLRAVERMDGFNVVRCPNWLLDRGRRWWNRILENITFGLSSLLNIWRAGRPDIVILETWPIIATDLIVRLCRHWQTPVLMYVQDCYPEALEYTGHIAIDGYLARLLRRWDKDICRKSSGIVVISDGMKRLLCRTRNIPEEKVSVIANWIDSRHFPAFERDNAWRREAGIAKEKFLVLFAGTLGHVSGAEVLVDVSRNLAHRPDVSFVCVGEGALKESMEHQASAAGLQRLLFLPFQSSERVAEMHAAADATILTTQAGYPDASVPSKLIAYLAAGRPVVCAAQELSTVAQIVREANAGVLAEPGNGDSIAEAIAFLADHPEESKQMGENARWYFENNLTFECAYRKFTAILEKEAQASCLQQRMANRASSLSS